MSRYTDLISLACPPTSPDVFQLSPTYSDVLCRRRTLNKKKQLTYSVQIVQIGVHTGYMKATCKDSPRRPSIHIKCPQSSHANIVDPAIPKDKTQPMEGNVQTAAKSATLEECVGAGPSK